MKSLPIILSAPFEGLTRVLVLAGILLASPLAARAASSTLAISTTSLPAATEGVAYTSTLVATGGKSPYSWSLASGTLPAGLTLTSAGVIAGKPTKSGTASVSVEVTDSAASTKKESLSLKVNAPPPPLAILYPNLNPGQVGVAYTQPFYATGGTAPYTWTLKSGAIPPGLVLLSSGSLTGTPTQSGGSTFTLQVTDAASDVATQTYGDYMAAPPFSIVTTTLAGAEVGVAYSATLGATGGTPPYGWFCYSSSFPPGLNLSQGGVISGTPSAPGSYQFQVEAADVNSVAAFMTYTVVVAPAPLAVTTTTLPSGQAGSAYTASLAAAGGYSPYTWSAAAGSLPAGLTLSSSGTISGTPSVASTASVTVTVTDASSSTSAATLGLVIAAPAALAASPASVPSGTVGTAYSQALLASGGVPPYSWSISAGALPAGLSLSATGVVSGTPTAAGDNPFTVLLTDSASDTLALALDIPVAAAAASGGSSGSGGSNGSGGTAPASYNVTVIAGTIPSIGSSTGSFPTGTVVTIVADTPPAGEAFEGWAGSAVTDPTAATTTLTVGASDATVTASFYTGASIPQPVTTHPRLWITVNDIARLQSWATASNPAYAQGVAPVLAQCVSDYQTQFFPGGTGSPSDVPNPTYPDAGDSQGYTGLISEQYALVFAFNALIDPSPSARILDAQRARNLIMYALNQAALGPLVGAPFRDPSFPIYNRAGATSEAWPLVVDWIYSMTDASGNPILTASDKATIQTVFLLWANECLNASTTGGDHPDPIGVANSQSLLPNGSAYRMASNNYYLDHARLVTLMSLAMDPADDPAVNPALPVSVLGNSVRSYIANATGAWLYQEYAMMGEPSQIVSDYGLAPNASVGIASGGLPPEGMLYGQSFATMLGQLLALKTAGFATPSLSGPQAALANNAPVWDRFAQGYLASMVPAAEVYPGAAYMGPVYTLCTYGDVLRTWVTPDAIQMYALLGVLDQQNGVSSRLNAERWFAVNAIEGGSGFLANRESNPWSYGVQSTLMYFMLLDPAAAAPTDPRPGYPTAFYDAPQGRLVEHTDWTANASIFDFRLSWISINHQEADGNSFELYRKGEWLTKTVANYDNNGLGLTTDYHNTMSLQNYCPQGTPDLSWYEGPAWTLGSQWQLGENAGDPTALVSVQPSYTYTYGDSTNLYNRPDYWSPQAACLDVLHASRSILWLKPDIVVVYDRETSQTPGLFKHFNLSLVSASTPVIAAGNGQTVVSTTTPGGQHLYATSLLPLTTATALMTVGPELNPIAELEPTNYRVQISDTSVPTDTRFLTTVQGADATVSADPVTLVQGAAGTAYDGAAIAGATVLFKRNDADSFAGVSFVEPASTTTHYVSGLVPGAGYTATTQNQGASNLVSIQSGGSITADTAGVITF